MVYVNPDKQLHIGLESDRKDYFTREKGKLRIKVTDDAGRPVQAHLGLSIFDCAYTNKAAADNMLSHCLLTTEIKGNIHNPAYYFNEAHKDRLVALDLLLLTQGWRKYVWTPDTLDRKSGIFLSDGINGKLSIGKKKARERLGNAGQLVQLFGPDGTPQFIITDSLGHFTISAGQMLALRGGYLYLKPMLDKTEFKPVFSFDPVFEKTDSLRKRCSSFAAYLSMDSIAAGAPTARPAITKGHDILLPEVTVTGTEGRVFRDKFMGRLDSLTQLRATSAYVCTSCHRLLNYRSGYDAHHAVNACPAKGRMKPVDGQTYLISKYEHYEAKGSGVAFRVVDEQKVTYHAPEFSEEELLRMNNIFRVKGYYGRREFYQPDETDQMSGIPDARNVLLWRPDIITDAKGEAEVEFFCSDIAAPFTCIVEGTDGLGSLGASQCRFRVKAGLK